MKTAVISGCTGQDGSFLAELLLGKGYRVYGTVRRLAGGSRTPYGFFEDPNFVEAEGDITDPSFICKLISEVKPDEYYNLAAQSHVGYSFGSWDEVLNTNGRAVGIAIDAIKNLSPETRLYQASTSEMFGGAKGQSPQNETTPMLPRSPYGCAKLYAHHMCRLARQQGLFVSTGILFNHEGVRRPESFVTRKITKKVAQIIRDGHGKIELGDISPYRDWGDAEEYVEAMYLMLQHSEPDEFVIGTGELHSVKEFLEAAWAVTSWDTADLWQNHFEVNEKFMRPTEVFELCADPSKAKRILGWEPKVTFDALVQKMVVHDLSLLKGVPSGV